MEFCVWFLGMATRNLNFLLSILFVNEAGFTRDGIFTIHTIGLKKNVFHESHRQCKFSVNV